MTNGAIDTVRIPGREPLIPSRSQRMPSPSVALKTRMEGELRGMLVQRRALVQDLAVMQQRLDELNMSINAAADMISRIDRDSLTQRLNDEIQSDVSGGSG